MCHDEYGMFHKGRSGSEVELRTLEQENPGSNPLLRC